MSQGFEYFSHVYMPATNDWTTDRTDQLHACAAAANYDEAVGHELPLQGPVNVRESPTGESALTLPWSHYSYAPGSARAHEDSMEQHFDYDNSPVKIGVHPASIAKAHNTPAVWTCAPLPSSSVPRIAPGCWPSATQYQCRRCHPITQVLFAGQAV